MSLLTRPSILAAALGLASIPGVAWLADDARADQGRGGAVSYEVTVTNVTRGQIFSPPVIATHSDRLDPVFALGEPASPELAGVAEDALNQPLIDKLHDSGEVGHIVVLTGRAGPIMPGETARVVVRAQGRFHRLSMAGMLVITNDAFFGLDSILLPSRGEVTLRSVAYDAGSEANNEQCANIPGPPCNNPMMRQTTGAEGYVHVHAGIHGIGDLLPAQHDWRGDVAQIRIRRLR